MVTILVSACLLGEKVRYDGGACRTGDNWLGALREKSSLYPFCPEMAAGLAVPRACAEITGGDGHDVLQGRAMVVDRAGHDLSGYFICGAAKALACCQENCIGLAVLMDRSPSCGSGCIYNGRFTGGKRSGRGVTAALLAENGIAVFNQEQVPQVLAFLAERCGI
jgi:uncharacterized protein YbbK (DUF523 family)